MAEATGPGREIALRALSRAAECVGDAAAVIGGAACSGTWRDLIAEARWNLDRAGRDLGAYEEAAGTSAVTAVPGAGRRPRAGCRACGVPRSGGRGGLRRRGGGS